LHAAMPKASAAAVRAAVRVFIVIAVSPESGWTAPSVQQG
jgi:hypothetical protein